MKVFSTREVKPEERFAYWRETLTQHFVHLRPETENRARFSSAIFARDLAGYSFSRVIAGAQRIHRAKSEIARSPHDLVFINLQARGTGSYVQAGEERALKSGDLFIIDAVRPFELGCPEPLSQLSLKLPRRLFADHLRDEADIAGALVSGGGYVGRLMAGYLAALWRDEKNARGSAVDHLVQLTGFELNRRRGRARQPREALNAARYERALGFIERNAADRALSPQRIADHAGVSLRALQLIFAARDQSIARTIQEARLESAARMLASPARRAMRIVDIALAAGFSELSHFTHAFAERFGDAPARWRAARV